MPSLLKSPLTVDAVSKEDVYGYAVNVICADEIIAHTNTVRGTKTRRRTEPAIMRKGAYGGVYLRGCYQAAGWVEARFARMKHRQEFGHSRVKLAV